MAEKDGKAGPQDIEDGEDDAEPVEKTRIVLPGPHANESSSDDEDGRRPTKSLSLKRPRDVHEILLNNNNGDESSRTEEANQTRTGRSKFPGAHRRKSGRWSAEIKDPFIKRKIWLGTFDKPEEASNAYAAKRLEFRERKESQSFMDRTLPEYESGRNGKQIDAGMNWEPVLTDNNGFLLGEFSNLDDDLTELNKFPKFPGAYRRKSGRWSSEIRDPFIKRQIRLGTFDTPEEASNAYTAKKLDFRERKGAKSYMDGTRPECDSGRNGEQIDAGRNWSGEQNDAGRNWEPITIDSNLDDDLTKLNKFPKFPGVYRRKSGRWWAEIRDPFIKRQIRLGTFDTPEEASNAYTAKKLEFRERKEAKSYMDGTRPQCDSGRNGEQIDARRNWSGEQIDAGRNWEPILIDSNGFLLGDFSNLDDDLRIS